MAFAAGNGMARAKNAGNSRGSEGSGSKPSVSPGVGNVCSSQPPPKVSAAWALIVAFFILSFLSWNLNSAIILVA